MVDSAFDPFSKYEFSGCNLYSCPVFAKRCHAPRQATRSCLRRPTFGHAIAKHVSQISGSRFDRTPCRGGCSSSTLRWVLLAKPPRGALAYSFRTSVTARGLQNEPLGLRHVDASMGPTHISKTGSALGEGSRRRALGRSSKDFFRHADAA
jgi:hypothetical protein